MVRLIHHWPRLLIILMPLIGLLGGLSLIHGTSIQSVMPAGPDDVFYWQQGRAFAESGFESGYFVAADQPALADWSHFYAWGVITPIFYGLIGKTIGWSLYAVPLIHCALLTLAVCVWLWAARPNRQQVLTATVVFVVYPPVILFAPTAMQEGFQQSLAIIAAAGFIALVRHPHQRSITIALGMLLVVMSLAKVTWAVLFFPYFGLVLRPSSRSKWLITVCLATILAVIAALWHRWTASPYPYRIGDVTEAGVVTIVLERLMTNLSALFNGHPLELQLRGLGISLMFASLWFGLKQWRLPAMWDVWVIGFTLLTTFGMIILLYEVQFFRDYRVIASPLLMTLFIISYTRPRWAWWGIAACVLVLPITIGYYQETTSSHVSERVLNQHQNWQDIWPQHVTYQPTAPSPWCNTVLVSPYYIFEGQGLLMALPAGVGISLFTLEGGFTFPAKSAYVLLSDDMAEMVTYQMRLERLRPAPRGVLYRNLDAPCW